MLGDAHKQLAHSRFRVFFGVLGYIEEDERTPPELTEDEVLEEGEVKRTTKRVGQLDM